METRRRKKGKIGKAKVYIVTATRITEYRVKATSREEAIDKMIDGRDCKELGGDTLDITVRKIVY